MTDRLPWWRRSRRRGYHLLVLAVLASVRALPDRAGRRLCRTLARMALRVRPREAEQARKNLATAYPQFETADVERLLRRCAGSLGEMLHATLVCDRYAKRGFPGLVEEMDGTGRGTAEVLAGLRARGKGALLLTGHLGCWEMLGAWLASRLGDVGVVTGTIRNPPVDALLQSRRRAMGVVPLPREEGLRPVLRLLDRGGAVGVLLDQNTGAASVPVDFFGRPAPTPITAARLALRRGLPVLPAACVREGGRWVVRHLPPLEPPPGADDRDAVQVAAFAERCNRALETLIRRNPAQWVWFHRRWLDAPVPARMEAT